MMTHRSGVSVDIAIASLVLMAIFHGSTGATQDLPPPSRLVTNDDPLSEVIVTGSRISRPSDERLEPTTVIGSDFISLRGYGNVIDALNELPAFGQPDSSLVGSQATY